MGAARPPINNKYQLPNTKLEMIRVTDFVFDNWYLSFDITPRVRLNIETGGIGGHPAEESTS